MSRKFLPAILIAVVLAMAFAGLARAQKAVKFDGYDKMQYVLTVEKQTAGQIASWWAPFVTANSVDGYCFDLNALPLADRPQIGDKAKILHVGGAGQLVQAIEIPPQGKTVWHGYGWEGEALFYVLSGRGQTDYKGVTGGLPSN